MRLEIRKKDFEFALSKAGRVAGKHVTLPVLSCVLLEASGDKLSIRATNLDLGLEIKVPAVVGEGGVVAVSAQVLSAYLSGLNDEIVNLETVESNLKVFTRRRECVIKCMESGDFPSIPELVESKKVSISTEELVSGVKSVIYSASNSNIKPELSSVYVYSGDSSLVFVSTDSFRLAEKQVKTRVFSDFPNVIIPSKNATEIVRIFEDSARGIEIAFETNQAAFTSGNIYVVSRLVDGVFPDYKQIIPSSYQTTVTLLKNELLGAIKTSSIFADSVSQIKVIISRASETLTIESRNNDVGESSERISAEVEGDDLELRFNSRYIVDCLAHIAGESLRLSFGGVGRPLVIRGVSDKSFLYLVMPMNR